MILLKPYGHLTKLGNTQDFQLSLSIVVPNNFDIIFSGREDINGNNLVRLTYELVALTGQVNNNPRSFLRYVDDVPVGDNIEIVVETDISSADLPNEVFDLIADVNATPLSLGKTVLATVGVEEKEDPRTGVTENEQSDPDDDQ
ncbi:MAG: hypothetical protein AAF696_12445 [Bacteroidota bacterium]